MNRPENDVPNYIRSLLDRGATILIFQEYIGATAQEYKTVLVHRNSGIVILYDRPLPFIIQSNGKIIENVAIPRPPNDYHPS